MPAELCDVTVWVLVDAEGNAVADCDPDHLRDEYEADIGDFDLQTPTRLVKITLRVPKPAPVEMSATVPDEPTEGELKVA